MTGIELIAKERAEQLKKHCITPEIDVRFNKFSQLIDGAGALLKTKPTLRDIPSYWDEKRWAKMCLKPYKERLIISAALIAAELDRMELAGE